MKQLLTALLLLGIWACQPKDAEKTTTPVATTPPVKDTTAPNIPPPKEMAGNEPAVTYKQYCNSRFEYCVDYPEGLFYPQPESENKDGRVFENKNGEEVMRVFGRPNMDADGEPVDLDQQYKNDLYDWGSGSGAITYQKLNKDHFVISGYKDQLIFYQKTILLDGAFGYTIVQYPEKVKAVLNPITGKIATSFKVY
jgi:hypothetical protein